MQFRWQSKPVSSGSLWQSHCEDREHSKISQIKFQTYGGRVRDENKEVGPQQAEALGPPLIYQAWGTSNVVIETTTEIKTSNVQRVYIPYLDKHSACDRKAPKSW